jgi:hypothetical protein
MRPGPNALVVTFCLQRSYLRIHHRFGFIPIPAATCLGVYLSRFFICNEHLEPHTQQGNATGDDMACDGSMTRPDSHRERLWQIDIEARTNGLNQHNRTGCRVNAQEIGPGIIYRDGNSR